MSSAENANENGTLVPEVPKVPEVPEWIRITLMEELGEFPKDYVDDIEGNVKEMRDNYQGSLTYEIYKALEEKDRKIAEKPLLPTFATMVDLLRHFMMGKKVELLCQKKEDGKFNDHWFITDALSDLAEKLVTKTFQGEGSRAREFQDNKDLDVLLVQFPFALDASRATKELDVLVKRGGSCFIYAGEAIENLPDGWKLAYKGDAIVLPQWDISAMEYPDTDEDADEDEDDVGKVILEWEDVEQKVFWRVYTKE